MIPYHQGQTHDHQTAQDDPRKGIGQMVGRKMLRLMKYSAHGNAQQGHQYRQDQILPEIAQGQRKAFRNQIGLCMDTQPMGHPAGKECCR